MVTGVLCTSMFGHIMQPMQIIFKGLTSMCHPRDDYDTLLYSHSENHWSTPETNAEWARHLCEWVESEKERLDIDKTRSALLVLDNFYANNHREFLSTLQKAKPPIHLFYLEPGFTDVFQPNDQVANKMFKNMVRSRFESWRGDQITTQLQHAGNNKDVVIQVDTNLRVMKPLLAQWWDEAVREMQKEENVVGIMK